MFFLPIPIYNDKYGYKRNLSEKKGKLSLAQPEAWVESLMILVSVTLCKISSRRLWLIFKGNQQTKKTKKKKKEKEKEKKKMMMHV